MLKDLNECCNSSGEKWGNYRERSDGIAVHKDVGIGICLPRPEELMNGNGSLNLICEGRPISKSDF